MVVPNKQFMTSHLVNWTLLDSRRRIDIPVQVEYGVKSKRVKAVLLEVARRNSNVLEEPAPGAILIEFSEHAIELELRIYVEFGLGVKTEDEVQEAIEEAFEQHGIKFAQPRLRISLPANLIAPASDNPPR